MLEGVWPLRLYRHIIHPIGAAVTALQRGVRLLLTPISLFHAVRPSPGHSTTTRLKRGVAVSLQVLELWSIVLYGGASNWSVSRALP